MEAQLTSRLGGYDPGMSRRGADSSLKAGGAPSGVVLIADLGIVERRPVRGYASPADKAPWASCFCSNRCFRPPVVAVIVYGIGGRAAIMTGPCTPSVLRATLSHTTLY